MDATVTTILQTAINNYDLSDLVNQTVILVLMVILFASLNIKMRFSRKHYW